MLATLVVLLAAAQGPGVRAAGEPPTDRDVLRALPRVAQGVPSVFEEFRDDVVIVKNRLTGRAVFLPLPAGASVTLAAAHWECAAYYTETTEVAFPFPFKATKKRVQVVYIDKTGVAK